MINDDQDDRERYDNEPEVTAETISMKGIHCKAA